MQRRAQRDARRRRVLALISVLGVLAVVAVVVIVIIAGSDEKSPGAGGGPRSPSTTATSATSATTATAKPTGSTAACTWSKTKDKAARTVKAPATTVSRKGTVTVAVTTNRGPLTFTLDRTKTPCTVASFVSLTEQKYYD